MSTMVDGAEHGSQGETRRLAGFGNLFSTTSARQPPLNIGPRNPQRWGATGSRCPISMAGQGGGAVGLAALSVLPGTIRTALPLQPG